MYLKGCEQDIFHRDFVENKHKHVNKYARLCTIVAAVSETLRIKPKLLKFNSLQHEINKNIFSLEFKKENSNPLFVLMGSTCSRNMELFRRWSN